jgi:hypothetical protein
MKTAVKKNRWLLIIIVVVVIVAIKENSLPCGIYQSKTTWYQQVSTYRRHKNLVVDVNQVLYDILCFSCL